jgi:hypothetical protein
MGESEAGIMKRTQLRFPAARHWPEQTQHDHLEGFEDGPSLTPKQKKFFRRRFCCVDRGKCTLCSDEYYMVRDELWAASGVEPNGGMLCLLCLERRIGRALTTADWTTIGPSLDAWQQHIATRSRFREDE